MQVDRFRPRPLESHTEVGEHIYATSIPQLLIIERLKFDDDRGSYQEKWRTEDIEKVIGRPVTPKQAAYSINNPGVVRGLHAETQDKLVTPVTGLMVAYLVDIRPDSPTFGKYEEIWFDNRDVNTPRRSLFIPEGVANSICVPKIDDNPDNIVIYDYTVTSPYNPNVTKRAVHWKDPDLNIPWPVTDPIVSEADKKHPFLRELYPDKLNG